MKKIRISEEWEFVSEYNEKMRVDLPHDYIISNPRNAKSVGGASNGFFDGGRGQYTKYLEFDNDEHVILDIDGAYMCSRVSLNDNHLVMHPNGYTPFLVDLTEKMRKGRLNKIQITTQHIQPSTRWYSGAGVYRDVYIWTGGRVRIEPWDVFITTKSIECNSADVSVCFEITSDIYTSIVLNTKIIDPIGEIKMIAAEKMEVEAGKNTFNVDYIIENPKLWSIDNPALYTLSMEILCSDKTEDTYDLNFGIRTISADPQNGLLLNGKPIKLQGGCIHHDHGALGAAAFPAAEFRKLSKLKDAGFNSVRIAHNPPSLALLEVCDRLGLLVMDEAFDVWNVSKSDLDYSLWFADWWSRDIKSMVLRDRNHPCVISYSIGNEIIERNGRSDGAEWAKKLSEEVRKYDSTKLVTAAVCCMWTSMYPGEDAPAEYREDFMQGYSDLGDGAIGSSWDVLTQNYMEPLDIVGYNYLFKRYGYDHINYPERIIWGSETHAIDFYHSWQAVLNNAHVIGDFTWTAYDNLGEAGTGRSLWEREGVIDNLSLGDYPWRSCYQGDFDLCGYRRPQSYFREAIWKKDCEPKIFTTHPEHYGEGFSGTQWHWYDVTDSWTFDDSYIGKPVKVEVYTDADEVRFYLNSRFINAAKPICCIATMDIMYVPGILTAETYRDGRKIKESSLHTVGKASKITITPEKTEITADNRDLCYFDIFITDVNGERVPFSENELKCICEGGELVCVFSGNPCNEDAYGSDTCHAFYGRAVAVVRAKEKGIISVTVKSDGLKSETAIVRSK